MKSPKPNQTLCEVFMDEKLQEQVSADLARSYRMRRLGREIEMLTDRLFVFLSMSFADEMKDAIAVLQMDLDAAREDLHKLTVEMLSPNEHNPSK